MPTTFFLEEERMQDSIKYPAFRWLVLLCTFLAYVSLCAMMALPPLLPVLEQSLGINTAAAAQILSISFLMAALSLIFVGPFSDKYGIMPSLVLSLLFAGIPSALMPVLGKSYVSIFILRGLTGIAAGFGFCIMSTVLAVWFPLKEKGLAAGIMGMGVSIGSMGMVFSPMINKVTQNWQQTVAWLSIPAFISLVITIIAWICQPQPPAQSQQPEQEDSSAFKSALKNPVTWVGVATTFCAACVMQVLYNLVPAYFASPDPKGLGFDAVATGKLMFFALVAGIVGPIVGGLLQDKVFKGNSKPVMFIGFALCVVFAFLMAVPSVYTSSIFLIVCLLLVGAGFQFVYTLIPVYISRTYPLSTVAKMVGVWMGIGMFGGFAGIALGGVAIEQFGKYATVILISVAALVGFILVTMLKKPTDSAAH